MNRKTVVAAVTATGVGVVLASSVGSSAQQPQGQTFDIVDSRNGATFKYIDNAPRTTFDREGTPRRTSIGDEIILVNRLTNPAGARGRGTFHCIATEGARRGARFFGLCTYDFRLPEGHLTGSGTANVFANRIEFAITGGTGAYAGARGTLVRIEGPENVNGGTSTVTLLP